MLKQFIRNQIDISVTPWLKNHGIGSLPSYSLEEPPKNIDADLASNIAMLVTKQLKTNLRKTAEQLASILLKDLGKHITRIEIAGAGFLNFTISDEYLTSKLVEILEQGNDFGKNSTLSKEKVLLEFVSANPTGPLHIGHGRGAAIGDSLARIFSHIGYSVQKEYYINDVGNQIEMLGKSVEARFRELEGEKVEFPQDGYKGAYIIDIAKKMSAGKEATSNPDFKEIALREMMSTIEKDLLEFDVRFDTFFSESKIAKDKNPDKENKTEVEVVLDFLKEKQFAYEKDDALWFASSKFGDDKDRVLKRSDGRLTYLASDIAYHKKKIERGFDKLINLWGADHHGYVVRMKAAIQAIGKNPDILTIILYQLVSLVRAGKPVTMSTRAGEFITLEEVVNEVGKDACRFFFMLRAPDSQLDFDLELAKKQSSENPVYYVQYVHARCSSIFKEYLTKEHSKPDKTADLRLLKTKEERELLKKLAFFPDTLELCVRNLSPHHLTTYLMELADIFHRFYEQCRVISDDKELTLARLSIVQATAIIIRNGLNLLGVSAPDKM